MDWVRGNTIGRGSTAAVYKAESRRSGKVFAVKSAELHRSEFLKREEEILSKMNCPQIVSYQGCDVTYENGVHYYNLCMEYARGGTLADAVRNGEVMDEALARRYTRQMLEGLKYLHANGIVHCDVKGQNVLLTDQGAKLADFGCAKRMGDVGATATAVAGTPAFMAPEVARGEQQGFPGDVWALGCTVLEMITGKPPWHGASDPAAVLFQVGFSGEIPEIPNSISKEGNDFLSKCFKSDPCERWTVSELLNHEFVRELNLVCDGFAFACDLESPRSVLGRGCIWESKTNEGLTRGSCSLDSPSPRDRIQSLCTSEPFWDWGDDDEKLEWVTVRSNDTDKEKLESIEKMENYGSDTVCNCILREDFDLVIFCAPKIILVTNLIEFSRWSAVIDECYYLSSCDRELLIGCSCLVIFSQWKWKYDDSFMKQFFIMQLFLLCLSLFSSTLDQLKTLQFIIMEQYAQHILKLAKFFSIHN